MSEYIGEHVADLESMGSNLRDEIRETRQLLADSLRGRNHGRQHTNGMELGGEHMPERSFPVVVLYGEEDQKHMTNWLGGLLDRKVKKFGYVQAHWVGEGTENLAYFVGKDVYIPDNEGEALVAKATERDMQEIHNRLLLPLLAHLDLTTT